MILFSINLFIVSLLAQTGTITWQLDGGKCLDAHPGQDDNIYLHPCHGGNNQKFRIGQKDAQGFYTITCLYNNECLDAHPEGNGVVNHGDNIYTFPCHKGDNQKWKVDGELIRSKANGGNWCLDIGDGGNNAHIWNCDPNNGNQKLSFLNDESFDIRVPSHGSQCLDAHPGQNDNIYLHPCHGGNNQKFKRGLADAQGFYSIVCLYNNECLDAHLEGNGVVNHGDNIYTHPCHNGDNQKWRIEGPLIKSKTNVGGSWCVDAGDSNKNVHIWNCDQNNGNQRFTFQGISAALSIDNNMDMDQYNYMDQLVNDNGGYNNGEYNNYSVIFISIIGILLFINIICLTINMCQRRSVQSKIDYE